MLRCSSGPLLLHNLSPTREHKTHMEEQIKERKEEEQ